MTPTATTYTDELVRLLRDVRCTRASASGAAQESLGYDDAMAAAAELLLALKKDGNKAILVGNGGSASVVGHLQMDLSNGLRVRALCFHDAPQLTALANDFGYPAAFERCAQLWADEGDLLVAVSSSGRSENVLRAVDAARSNGCRVLTMSGFHDDNPLRGRGHLNFHVASHDYGPVETAHACIAHMVVDLANAFGRESGRGSP